MPEEDEWIRVVGILEAGEELRPLLRVQEITIMETRGQDFVTR